MHKYVHIRMCMCLYIYIIFMPVIFIDLSIFFFIFLFSLECIGVLISLQECARLQSRRRASRARARSLGPVRLAMAFVIPFRRVESLEVIALWAAISPTTSARDSSEYFPVRFTFALQRRCRSLSMQSCLPKGQFHPVTHTPEPPPFRSAP